MTDRELFALCVVLILMTGAHLRAALRIRELKRACRVLEQWCIENDRATRLLRSETHG